jgi:hypothetical protein
MHRSLTVTLFCAAFALACVPSGNGSETEAPRGEPGENTPGENRPVEEPPVEEPPVEEPPVEEPPVDEPVGDLPQVGGTPRCDIFPADNPWNQDITDLPVHPRSEALIDGMGRDDNLHPDFGTEWDGAPNGIPYVLVDGDQPRVPVAFDYDDESDPGPYPIPADAPVEGGPDGDGDRHVIVIDERACVLYELFYAFPENGATSWSAGSGAIFDLGSNDLRPDYWTSADAAGLPIFPGLVRYDEVVEQGAIEHALRFTLERTRRAFVHPATHYASDLTDEDLSPMGLRLRMRAGYDCSGLSDEVQVICTALKRYGMLLADNGGNGFVSGAPDPRWSDDNLGDLKDIPFDAFEVVDTGAFVGD